MAFALSIPVLGNEAINSLPPIFKMGEVVNDEKC